ncbi:Spy/CpxP family protein refolding chaperone [Phenylobacterium aquaticum]|uniref:Spy/CpxP family protein refolding chaperone n=1 Tax=Phenylobacterium aquaticum TaxID=1763816 RepID=UPI001F5DC2F3|nr:periplasmic heavy metal sensor [Phenylobacterium aquaticum]MCI3132805.1 periplasmic heavy metal sensor [Phenylobacterium aquaticum]
MSLARSIILTLVLSILAAAVGVWGGVKYVASRAHPRPGLDEMLHQRVHLTAEQERRIEGLERDHAGKRRAMEAEMRAANAALAQSYQESHAYSPKVQAAIDRFHWAMDAMQKETMIHVIAMRAVLTPDQAAQFDDMVVKSLTADGS